MHHNLSALKAGKSRSGQSMSYWWLLACYPLHRCSDFLARLLLSRISIGKPRCRDKTKHFRHQLVAVCGLGSIALCATFLSLPFFSVADGAGEKKDRSLW